MSSGLSAKCPRCGYVITIRHRTETCSGKFYLDPNNVLAAKCQDCGQKLMNSNYYAVAVTMFGLPMFQ